MAGRLTNGSTGVIVVVPALVDVAGRVLGINTSGLTSGAALTIPANLAWTVAEALGQHGRVRRGYLGVRTQTVDIPDAGQTGLKREQRHGLLVLWLEAGGPAEKAGLLIGDIVVGVGGQQVSDPDDLFAALNSESVGKRVPVEVLRGGKPEVVTITVAERK